MNKTYYVVQHCRHAYPIGPCGICAKHPGDPSQPRVLQGPMPEDTARFNVANRNSRATWEHVAYAAIELGTDL